jgi:hypothetical protein
VALDAIFVFYAVVAFFIPFPADGIARDMA